MTKCANLTISACHMNKCHCCASLQLLPPLHAWRAPGMPVQALLLLWSESSVCCSHRSVSVRRLGCHAPLGLPLACATAAGVTDARDWMRCRPWTGCRRGASAQGQQTQKHSITCPSSG